MMSLQVSEKPCGVGSSASSTPPANLKTGKDVDPIQAEWCLVAQTSVVHQASQAVSYARL